MNLIEQYINSGILELYVLGKVTDAERADVEAKAGIYPEIQLEIDHIADALEEYAMLHAVTPDATFKPFLLAVLDYTERLTGGEQPAVLPVLSETTRAEDFAPWLSRDDMALPADFEDIYVKIIGYTPEATTAIVWIRAMAPQEVHHDEHEKFFILEGTCEIIVEEEVHALAPGDYFSIPLHKSHRVKVTSDIPCRVILQRIAA